MVSRLIGRVLRESALLRRIRHSVRLVATFAFLLFAWRATLVQANPMDDLLGTTDKNWTEIVPVLPAKPVDTNLVSFYVSPQTRFRFAVDIHSITIGKDGVVHYTLVATSEEGISNVSFEGMRCATKERKTYAYGRADGTWIHARSDPWEPVAERDGPNRQDAALYKDVVCKDGLPLNVKEVVTRLEGNPYTSLPH